MLPAQPNQSLMDGLELLQALAGGDAAMGSRELARATGLEPTRVNRLLKTLAHLGLAEQTADRRYQPGPGMHVLSAQALHGSGLLRRAIGPLETLHRWGRTVALGVLWRGQTCYLYHAAPGMNAAEAIGRVGLYPATQSGLGMVLLAARPWSDVKALYEPPATPGAAETGGGGIPGFASLAKLKRELGQIHQQGYALVDIAGSPNRTLAVAVGRSPYAAVGVSGQIKTQQVSSLVVALRDAAEAIDQQMRPSRP